MKLLGAVIIALGLLVAVIPAFNTCESEGKFIKLANGREIPMKCSWTARAEVAMGVSLMTLGGLLAVSKRQETRRNLGLMAGVMGVFVVLLPTALIGVCTDMTASCNLIMRPAMAFMGTLTVGSSLAVLVLTRAPSEAAITA